MYRDLVIEPRSPAIVPDISTRTRNRWARCQHIGRTILAAFVLAAGVVAASAPAAAQVVRGKLLDTVTKKPIVLGRVALLDTTLAIVDQTYADEDGEFTLNAPRPGAYYVAADRAGYTPRIDGILDLGENGRITVEFNLKPNVMRGEPIDVVTPSVSTEQYLRAVGFEERRAAGLGYFMTREDIERAARNDVAALFAAAPAARVVQYGNITTLIFRGGSVVSDRGGQHGTRPGDPLGYCTPRIIVDGLSVNATSFDVPGAVLNDVVIVEEIVGVEVHSGPASLPIQFSGTSTSCTTVMFWTMRGR